MTQFSFQGVSSEKNALLSRVLQAALAAADPRIAVRRALNLNENQLFVAGQTLDLDRYRRIRLVGVGKAAEAMALGLVDRLGERIHDGCLVVKHRPESATLPDRIALLSGGHPVPTAESVASAAELLAFLQDSDEGDLVFCLISGGGSALIAAPGAGITLEDLQQTTKALLACGASINEMNTLRKHLDRVKGGGLARAAAPASLVALILSDVVGSPLDVIASGPTVADSSTYRDAWNIVEKYALQDRFPASVMASLRAGLNGALPETVKPGDPCLERVYQQIIASNPQAADAALQQAREDGFHPLLLTTYLQGEAAQAGEILSSILRQIDATGQPLPRPACIVAGGETTVTLHGHGRGGRNQELALGAVLPMAGLKDVALITLATDGEDGPTHSAGALVTGETLERALALGLDPLAALRENDSYPFFVRLGDSLLLGPTGTNVNDLTFLFAF